MSCIGDAACGTPMVHRPPLAHTPPIARTRPHGARRCTCLCACMHTKQGARTCMHIGISACVCTQMHISVCLSAHTCTCMQHIYTCLSHTHAYAHAHVTRCVCMFTHMHTHTGTHVHVSFCVCMCLDGGVYLCTRDSACRFVSLGTYVYICSHVLLLG